MVSVQSVWVRHLGESDLSGVTRYPLYFAHVPLLYSSMLQGR